MFDPRALQRLNDRGKNTMVEHLGIEITEIGENFIRGKMPVDHRTQQPLGLLHGGANVALAETLGSIAANELLDHEKQYAVGLEINANHLKSAREGYVYGITRPIHLGKKVQVWEIRVENEKGELTCVSRLTMAVLNK